jgi:hypothetical protein
VSSFLNPEMTTQCLHIPHCPDFIVIHTLDGFIRFYNVFFGIELGCVYVGHSSVIVSVDPSGAFMAVTTSEGFY